MEAKKIILIVTGSIAAFKGIELYHKLKKHNNIELVITRSVKFFCKNIPSETHTSIFNKNYYDKNNALSSNHIKLSKDANLLIVYPASANYIAKIANGICDDLASLLYAYSNKKTKKIIQPAMNNNMYLSKINKNNLKKIKSNKTKIIKPNVGKLACNKYAIGRAKEVIEMLKILNKKYNIKI